jgi:hypothetical protein
MSLPSDLRKAAEKLSAYKDGELGRVAAALSALLNREADIQTTMAVLDGAGYESELLLDASLEARALAHAINESNL